MKCKVNQITLRTGVKKKERELENKKYMEERELENIKEFKELKELKELKEKTLKNNTCNIIKKHHEDMKNDPESLSTEFMLDIIKVDCKNNRG